MTARILVAACALLAAGCAWSPSRQVQAEGWTATLSWTPPHPVALQPVTLRLRVAGSSGAVPDADGVQAEAAMPEMEHGGETVEFRRVGPGTYEARHAFSMDGRWVIRLRAQPASGIPDAAFPVEVGR